MNSSLPLELKPILQSVISAKPSHRAVNDVVEYCQKIANVYLQWKIKKLRYVQDFFQFSLNDIAVDCIADLFQRDENGTLVQIKAYFDSIQIETASEEELTSHLRGLVFSRVNNSLFRLFNEADPSLGKILRNIKLAVQTLRQFEIIERFGEISFFPAKCETLEHLPTFSRKELGLQLRNTADGNDNIPTLLAKIATLLRQQKDRSRIVSFVFIAVVIRDIYSNNEQAIHRESDNGEFMKQEAVEIIHYECSKLANEVKAHYLRKNVSPELFQTYFEIIERYLVQRLFESTDGEISLFEHLKEIFPQLTFNEFEHTHKSKLWYLSQLTYQRVVKKMSKEYL